MRTSKIGTVIIVVMASCGCWSTPALAQETTQRILEAYPPRMQASMEIYQRQLENAALSGNAAVPFYLIVPKIQRWTPGSTVRVAFNGGNDALFGQIRDAALAWTRPNGANLNLVFTGADGKYLRWSTSDQGYTAEIRIAFIAEGEDRGYWSAVGTNSVAPAIVGGRPNEPSLNLGGFDRELPANWRAVVFHEFGHALGFQHEHQSPTGGCDFRFDDDPGYVLTMDAYGWYTTDQNGKRPGLYTYLGGKANYWPRARVDANLRALPTTSAYLISAFDKVSIMKYFFDSFMFINGEQSPCYTPSDNQVLSQLDLEGASKVYPRAPAAISSINNELSSVLEAVRSSPNASQPLRDHAALRLRTELGQ